MFAQLRQVDLFEQDRVARQTHAIHPPSLRMYATAELARRRGLVNSATPAPGRVVSIMWPDNGDTVARAQVAQLLGRKDVREIHAIFRSPATQNRVMNEYRWDPLFSRKVMPFVQFFSTVA